MQSMASDVLLHGQKPPVEVITMRLSTEEMDSSSKHVDAAAAAFK